MTATQLFEQWIVSLKDRADYSPDALALEAFCAGHAAAQPKPDTPRFWVVEGDLGYGVENIAGPFDSPPPARFEHHTIVEYVRVTPPAPPEQKE